MAEPSLFKSIHIVLVVLAVVLTTGYVTYVYNGPQVPLVLKTFGSFAFNGNPSLMPLTSKIWSLGLCEVRNQTYIWDDFFVIECSSYAYNLSIVMDDNPTICGHRVLDDKCLEDGDTATCFDEEAVGCMGHCKSGRVFDRVAMETRVIGTNVWYNVSNTKVVAPLVYRDITACFWTEQEEVTHLVVTSWPSIVLFAYKLAGPIVMLVAGYWAIRCTCSS